MRKLVIFVAAMVIGTGVLLAAKSHAPKIDPQRIRQHVKYLASDALEGRGTGQKGGDLAADYIAAQFKSYGLKPAGENGTYFQNVPLVGVKTLPETSFALVPASGEPMVLRNLDDFVTSNETQTETANIDAPIVFVGYGITAPEEKWDDYKGYDLKGKVALLFVNEPISDDPSFFKGKALTYNGRWTYKYEETARRGAVATLIIHRTDLASYGWEVVRNSWGGERSFLKLDGTPKLEAASWIQEEVARKLVGMAGLDLDMLFQQAQSREFKPIELPVHLKAHVVSVLRPFNSRNVLGMVEGDYNSSLRADAVLYTAHYDHFGIDKTKSADNIYHGAVDNATGCGILLEVARAWGVTKPAPTRTILFAAVTAEEQGLLGSEYLGKHSLELPVDPILDLNYDALAPIGIPEEVQVSGAERTTFYPAVEKIAGEFELTIRPDAQPEAGHYYRSDHFSLSRVGIPSFSIGQGRRFKDHDVAWGEAQAKDYVDNRYHKPADAFREDWKFEGLAKMASFGYALGGVTAAQSVDIRWLHGDEFEEAWYRSRSGGLDIDALFAGHPEFKPVHFEGIRYPPLARQTRISGTVVAHVSVASDGSVVEAKATKGHPLLVGAVEDSVKRWRFVIGAERTFDLQCDFVLADEPLATRRRNAFVVKPLHLRVVAEPAPISIYTAKVSSRSH
jgi:Zn-dependent M28 family amino/carboxypeptidase